MHGGAERERHSGAPPPSRSRIILDPSQSRTALLAQSLAHPLDRAHRAQEIARGDFGEGAFRKATAEGLGERGREGADMLEAERLGAAEEIRADADMIDSCRSDEVDDMVGELIERRARRVRALGLT